MTLKSQASSVVKVREIELRLKSRLNIALMGESRGVEEGPSLGRVRKRRQFGVCVQVNTSAQWEEWAGGLFDSEGLGKLYFT
jgi:hypothetical protein